MKQFFVRTIVRCKLSCQSIATASAEARKWKRAYLELVQPLSSEEGSRVITIPTMLGVDEEMTNWSFYQLLAHNTIVNNAMSRNVTVLMTGQGREELDAFDPKTDVLPEKQLGQEQVELFSQSVLSHLKIVSAFDHLKSTERSNHPLFGSFDAHMWHGMLGFHLKVHLKQAQITAKRAQKLS